MHLSFSAVADNTHQDPFPDIHSGSSGDPLTRDCPIYVQSVFRWRLLDFLHCSATSLSEGWVHFVLIPFSRTVEPKLEIILITQGEGEGCDFRWLALYFWSLSSKDKFCFIIFLYKQYETKALTVSFPSEENLELSMKKLEPFAPFWDTEPSGQITNILAKKSLDESP